MAVTDFPTKTAVVVRDDLASWQRLNVTAFLVSGLIGAAEADAIGEPYEDADGVAYLPLLLTQRGGVSADTKTYLYLDPSKLMSRAWSMWDPSIGLGTVTHQNVGFLWPIGPFFWLLDRVGVPRSSSPRAPAWCTSCAPWAGATDPA